MEFENDRFDLLEGSLLGDWFEIVKIIEAKMVVTGSPESTCAHSIFME